MPSDFSEILSPLLMALRLLFFPAGTEELPEIPAIPPGTSTVYAYNGFTLQFNAERKVADWVAYELTAEEVRTKNAGRSDRFHPDATIPEETALPGEYRRSGYDRGHLAPAADMRFSAEAMYDSFCMTNIAPQTPALNRGPWKDLEEEVRDWALQEGSLLVVTGPVFTTKTISTIGAGQVAVPDFFYKVLLDYTPPEKKGIAFLFPNRPEQNRRGGIFLYALSIDEIEARTSVDFFPWLPEEEVSLEAEADIFLWQ